MRTTGPLAVAMPAYRAQVRSASALSTGRAGLPIILLEKLEMRLFLDTANIDEIREVARMGILSGVTTNPSLMAKESGVDLSGPGGGDL